jgi:hypothetical protein
MMTNSLSATAVTEAAAGAAADAAAAAAPLVFPGFRQTKSSLFTYVFFLFFLDLFGFLV